METDWKTKLLALNANIVVTGNMRQHRHTAIKKFKSQLSAKGSSIDIVSPECIFKDQYEPEVYTSFLKSDVMSEIQKCNIPSAHVIWMLETIKKLTVEERRQFIKVLSSSNPKFTSRRNPIHMFSPAIVISALLNDKAWKQNYNALRDFVYPKNRNTTTQAQ